MSVNVGSAIGYLDLDFSGFSNGFKTASAQLQTFTDKSNTLGERIGGLGGALKSAGANMTKTFTLPLLAAGIASGKMAIDTEQSMSKVNSILQLSGKEWSNYENTLKQGANEIGLSYSKYADAAYDAVSAGVEQANVTQFLTGANKLAKGGLTDLTNATNLLTTVQNAYGLEQKDLSKVSDILIQTQNKGKVTVDELASSMGKIIPTAKSLGIGVDQLGAGYAIMTSKGIASAEATTYMNSMFNELGKSGTKASDAIKELSGKSFQELISEGKSTGDILQMLSDHAGKSGKSLADMFGSAEAGKAALTLLSDGADGFNGMLNEMQNSAGSTDKAFNEMNNTLKEKLGQSFEKVKNALADVGKSMDPVITFIADLITKFAEWVSWMAQTHPAILNVMVVLAGLLAAIGPVLLIIGQMVIAIGGLITFFGAGGVGAGLFAGAIALITGPVGLVIGAIAALIAIGVLLYKNWDTIKAKASEIWQGISDVIMGALNWLGEQLGFNTQEIFSIITDTWNSIKDTLGVTIDVISQTISNAWNGIKEIIDITVGQIFTIISEAWNNIKDTLSMVGDAIKQLINGDWEGAKETIRQMNDKIKEIVGMAWDRIKVALSQAGEAIKQIVISTWNKVKSDISNSMNNIKQAITDGWNNVKNSTKTACDNVKKIAKTIFDGIKSDISNAMSNAWNTAKSWWDKIAGIFKNPIKGVIEIFKKEKSMLPPEQEDLQNMYSDGNYSNAKFDYTRARQTSMSDVMASNESMTSAIDKVRSNVKVSSNDANSFDYNKIIDKINSVKREIVVPVSVNGKEFARVIAEYTDVENGNRLNFTERGLTL